MRQRKPQSATRVTVLRLIGWRFAGVFLGITALALQTLIPLAQAIPVSGNAPLEQSLLFHCKLMKAGTAPATPQPTSGQDEDCLVCIAGAIGHCLIAPVAIATVFLKAPTTIISHIPEADRAAGRTPTRTVARSPPPTA